MSGHVLESVAAPLAASKDDDYAHLVCHCTNNETAACGKDVSGDHWCAGDSHPYCLLCSIEWPVDSPTCPWGCACDEC